MEKFKVMKYNQISMSWVGIHSKNPSEPSNEFFKSIGAYYVLFCAISFTIGSSAVFVYKYSSNFELVSEPSLIVIAGLQCVGMFVSVGLNMKTIKMLHIELQEIVEQNIKGEIFNIYWKTEQKCRKLTKLMSCYPLMLTFVAAVLYSVYCMLTGNRDTSTWILPYKLSVPFDTKTIHGWYLLWFVQTNVGLSYSLVMVMISSYFVCCCLYICALGDHFDYLIYSLKDDVGTDQDGKNLDFDQKKYRKIKDILSQAVCIHTKVFDIFQMVADINSGVIFSLLPVNAIFLALTFYNTEHSSFDWVMLVFHVICIISSLCWPFLFCYYATLITARISFIGDVAYNSNWFNYPPEYQKYLILIIARSQELIYFTGFGLIRCTLETLGKLCRTACSYYILFRSLSHH